MGMSKRMAMEESQHRQSEREVPHNRRRKKRRLKMKITKPKEAHHLLLGYHRAHKEHKMNIIKKYNVKLANIEEGFLIIAYGFQEQYGWFEKGWVIDAYYDLDWYGRPRAKAYAYQTLKKLEKMGFTSLSWESDDRFKKHKMVLTLRGMEVVKSYLNSMNKYIKDYGGLTIDGHFDKEDINGKS